MLRKLTIAAVALLLVSTASAADPPSLRVWTANIPGSADLMPGQRLEVVIELRGDEARTWNVSSNPPTDMTLESAEPSSGTLTALRAGRATAPSAGITWTGEVSATQPVNIVLIYRVLPKAHPGDQVLTAIGYAGGTRLTAGTLIRVCCVSPPDGKRRIYIPVMRR